MNTAVLYVLKDEFPYLTQIIDGKFVGKMP